MDRQKTPRTFLRQHMTTNRSVLVEELAGLMKSPVRQDLPDIETRPLGKEGKDGKTSVRNRSREEHEALRLRHCHRYFPVAACG
jgi:hypothetical protein